MLKGDDGAGDVVVTEVLDGWPGWRRVRKPFLGDGDDVRPMCVNARPRGAAGTGRDALGCRVNRTCSPLIGGAGWNMADPSEPRREGSSPSGR